MSQKNSEDNKIPLKFLTEPNKVLTTEGITITIHPYDKDAGKVLLRFADMDDPWWDNPDEGTPQPLMELVAAEWDLELLCLKAERIIWDLKEEEEGDED